MRSVSAQLMRRLIGCGSAIALRSEPKAAARESAEGPLVGAQGRAGGIRLAITSEAVFSLGRVTASAATRSTRSCVSR